MQTRRHTALLNLIKVPQLAFVINKMDQLNFDPKAFHLLEALVVELCDELQIKPAGCIPVSALTGEGVSSSGPNLSWYKGPCLLDFLGQSAHKQAHFNRVDEQAPLVFSIQAVARDQGETRDPIRAYLGWAAQGQLRKGDWLIDFASRQEARVLDLFPARLAELDGARTDQHDEQHKRQEDEQTVVGEPLALILDNELDLGRGDTLLGAKVLLEEGLMQAFHAKFCWLDDEALNLQRRYEIQHGTKRLKARIVSVDKVLNINTMYFEPCDGVITANTIGVMQIELQAPIFALPYEISRELGSFALIHEHDQSTAAAGMILKRGDSGGV
jgi:sulfate adenylyltransferase subunit 1